MKRAGLFLAIFIAFHHVDGNDQLLPEDPLFQPLAMDGFDEWDGNTTNSTTTMTTVVPTTAAPSIDGQWSFNYSESGRFCILMKVGNIDLEITYPTNNGSHKILRLKVPLNNTHVIQGLSECGANLTKAELNETLALELDVGNHTGEPYAVTVQFFFSRDPYITADKALDKSQLFKIAVSYLYRSDIFVDIDPKFIGHTVTAVPNGTLKEFVVLADRSYQCRSTSSIKINDQVTMTLSGIRSQAFLAHDYFSTPEPCPADAQSSDLVPIVIGSVLAAVVLIVLIAYLIGRARARRNTYESI